MIKPYYETEWNTMLPIIIFSNRIYYSEEGTCSSDLGNIYYNSNDNPTTDTNRLKLLENVWNKK